MMRTWTSVPRMAFSHGAIAAGDRALPEEVAVALSYNGATQAVMMATPADLVDFAYGFTLTEGLATADEIDSVEPVVTERGIDLQIWLGSAAGDRLAARRRTMTGPVGCGLCGIDSLAEALRSPRAVLPGALTLTPDQVSGALAALSAHQPLHDATRAVHAAAFWTPDRGVVAAREDVGRHNALDKLAGALIRSGDVPAGAVVLSSRVSIDMVQKCSALGAPVLIAASAPTAAAVAMAEQAGLTLAALARPDRFEIFAHPERIRAEATAMSPEKLVHMANQIALFMESKPRAEAAQGVANHINDYWEPRMRREFLALLDAGRPDLRPLVLEASPLIRRPDETAS